MSEKAPLIQTISIPVEPVSTAGNDLNTVICAAPFAGTVTSVTYTPLNDITGVATNNRTVSVVNAGADGAGTTEIAEEQFVSGVDAEQYVGLALTLASDEEDLAFAAGDVLVWKSTHVATGLADPGGTVTVTLARG